MNWQKKRPANEEAEPLALPAGNAGLGGGEKAMEGPGISEFLPSSWRHDWLLGLFLVAAIVLAYQPVWHAGFIWDDDAHLTGNPCIVGPVGFKGIWTSSAAVYYPLVLTSFWVQHALWGLRPLPYHLVNVAMHGACAILLWRVLRRLHVRGAWLGAALWALHPVQAESVAWITELKNTQSCLFYLLAIHFFLKWRKAAASPGLKGGEWHYALAWLCATLAILSKASTVMLPVVLGLCWWWMEGRWRWRNVLRLAPFFLISTAASLWTIWEQKFHSGAMGPAWAQTWPERIVIAGKVVWFYLGKLFWPHPVIFIYPRWPVAVPGIIAYLPVLLAAISLVGLWLDRRRTWPVFFAFAYFVVSLFPVLDFFNVYFFRYSFVGDHFQYLASIGPLALAAAAITAARGFFKGRTLLLKPAFCGLLVVTLGTLTWKQCGMYANAGTLWLETIRLNPGCWMAHYNLGTDLLQKGRVDEAITHFQESLQIKPDDAEAHNNLGNALLQKGKTDEAMVHFQKALEFKPNYEEAHNNLGNVLRQKGRVEEAITHFEQALQIKPDYAIAHNDLGSALRQEGKVDEAITHFKQALQIKPDFVLARYNLGNALLQMGRLDEAITQYQLAAQFNPGFAQAHYNLGNALLQKGNVSAAIAQFQQALQLEPANSSVQNNLAWLLATCPQASLRNGAKAVGLARRANELTGGENPLFLNTLAAAFAEAGRFPEAVETAQRALRLAGAQSNVTLAGQLQFELQLYQAGSAFHFPEQSH
jgi:tetratricopeptide (TPR) repeat protein